MGPKPTAFDSNKRVKRVSNAHEKRIAKETGGFKAPASGGTRWSRWSDKTTGGDVKTETFLIEHKMTDKASMVIHQEWLDKVRDGAGRSMKTPMVLITFHKNLKNDEWCLVPRSFLAPLMDKEEEE